MFDFEPCQAESSPRNAFLPPLLSLVHPSSQLGNTHSSFKPLSQKTSWLLHHPIPFGTDHSLLGCLPLSTQLSSLHLPPSTSNLFPGFTLCFPSWIHLLLVYAGYCHLDWIIPSLHSTSTLILPLIYFSHKQQTDFSNAHTAPWCLCLTFQRLPRTADSILRKKSQILHVWLCDLSLLPSWSHFSSQSLMEDL